MKVDRSSSVMIQRTSSSNHFRYVSAQLDLERLGCSFFRCASGNRTLERIRLLSAPPRLCHRNHSPAFIPEPAKWRHNPMPSRPASTAIEQRFRKPAGEHRKAYLTRNARCFILCSLDYNLARRGGLTKKNSPRRAAPLNPLRILILRVTLKVCFVGAAIPMAHSFREPWARYNTSIPRLFLREPSATATWRLVSRELGNFPLGPHVTVPGSVGHVRAALPLERRG